MASRGELTPDGKLACRSCPQKPYPWPASYIASPKLIDGTVAEWPVCDAHMEHAMIAGWFPIRKIDNASPKPSHSGGDG